MNTAFITGSMAYGTPHEESDIDLVVLMSPEDLGLLLTTDGKEPENYAGSQSASLKFGKLNVLACTTESAFATWREGTEQLKAMKPVTREVACGIFSLLRAEENAKQANSLADLLTK